MAQCSDNWNSFNILGQDKETVLTGAIQGLGAVGTRESLGRLHMGRCSNNCDPVNFLNKRRRQYLHGKHRGRELYRGMILLRRIHHAVFRPAQCL